VADATPPDAVGEPGRAELVGREVLTIADGFAMPTLRALHAIDVASSLLLDDLGLLISYDAHQLRAAAEAGLAIASPGRA
jgi:hypothetical protein